MTDVVENAFDPSTLRQRQEDLCECKDSLCSKQKGKEGGREEGKGKKRKTKNPTARKNY